MASTSTTKDSTSALLELPAELRNRIYRFTLCEDDKIIVTQDEFQQPPLLRTCRRLRQETSGIYYLENQFEIPMDDFNPTVVLSWYQHADSYLKQEVAITFDLSRVSSISWPNLMRWVKLSVIDRKIFSLQQDGRNTPSWNVATGVFGIAKKLMISGTEWSDIEAVLEVYKVSTGCTVDWDD